MKKSILLFTLAIFSATILIDCSKSKSEDKTPLLAGLVLLNQKKGGSGASSTYSNVVTGSSEAIAGSSASTAAASSATSNATSSATSAATNVLSASIQDVAAKANESANTKVTFNDANTCNGSTKTATGTYKTAFTTTAGSGSYTVTPNITTKIDYSCTYSSTNSTFNGTYTNTGSLSIVFSNATISYFDVESFVKNGTFAYKTTKLTGTVTVSDIKQSSSGNSTITSTTSGSTTTLKSSYTSNGSYSDSVSSSNLVADSNAAATFSLTEDGLTSFSQSSTSTITGSTYSYCTNSISVDMGGKVSGTYNGSAVSTSYALTTDNYKKFAAAQGYTITMCQ